MNVQQFFRESGFKVLAMARLKQCDYSILLYLLNCAVSGLDQLITTEAELAGLINYDLQSVRDSLTVLASRNMVRLHYGDQGHATKFQSMRLGLQLDMSKWVLELDSLENSQDAVIFPFRRQKESFLHVVEGQRSKKEVKGKSEQETWTRVLESFLRGRDLSSEELAAAEESARALVQTHPIDQILFVIRHFGQRIPTLSLLASSWQHYLESFEDEHQKVDLLGARQKHIEQDQKLRDIAKSFLEKKSDLNLTEEETSVLEILSEHRHPRRQLFWAYQLRIRYPNLTSFFADSAPLMLPVTTAGTVIKRPPD